jgi:hypothetical protein
MKKNYVRSKWDLFMESQYRGYDGHYDSIENDGLYRNVRTGRVKFSCDQLSESEIALLSGECVTIVKGREFIHK